MAESYEIPILFTEQQREAYAAWGIKKEKVLLPFAAVTVLIDIAAIIFVAIKVWGIRESDHLMFQILVQSEWFGMIADFLAIGMTVLLLGPINYLLDKIWKKPQDPLWLWVTLDKTVVKVSSGSGKADADNVMTEAYPLGETATFLNAADNAIYYDGKWRPVGVNTIESIYPPGKQHPWMDHPDNKAKGISSVARLCDIMKGYEASLKAAQKEREWQQHNGYLMDK